MASRLTEIAVDSHDPHRLARFWADVLGYRVISEDDDGVSIGTGDGTTPDLVFVVVPEGKTVKNRIHLDVNATDRDQAAEVERLLALGARPADVGQGEQTWVVLADPEGNEFCVLHRTVPAHPEPVPPA